MNRAFKGIWIPKEIWLSKDLSIQEKIFIVEIDSLEDHVKGGCYAGNKYFSEFFGVSESRVSNIIKTLVSKKMITRKVVRTQNGSVRYLNVSHYLKTVIAHSHNLAVRTSHIQDSQSAESDNIIIHSNNTFSFKKKKSKIINANPRKK
ncbi:helix-turn-helix protein [Aquimarina sp. MAR_2010_214]|uniref:helix-turn-helix domain-containing protein n=1 Tax=Aquimarina sp. MAR_2010_214 TaxID=1250026 RepID=UPI000C7119CD|nr:helix-turn-helix domain-containing protein [Aquimarina sp. MAR_2010_214]PKV49227.1 helix-turn-helix protein [Aquimarina sp. MAR_2010_214]